MSVCENNEQLNELESCILILYEENRKLKKTLRKCKDKARKCKVGRPPLKDSDIFLINSLRNRGKSYRQISDLTGFSKSVICKYCNRDVSMGSSNFENLHSLLEQEGIISCSDENTHVDEPVCKEKYKNVGRNASCPCGSGRKYKHCCL